MICRKIVFNYLFKHIFVEQLNKHLHITFCTCFRYLGDSVLLPLIGTSQRDGQTADVARKVQWI